MASSQNMSRKRPAPGAAPMDYQQQLQPQPQAMYPGAMQQPLTDDQFLNWGDNTQGTENYINAPMYPIQPNNYGAPPPNLQPSNQLARRPMNQLAQRQTQNQWPAETAPQPIAQESANAWSDDVDELLEKAQIAKRDAQAKRKQIPPFVLKLHSFLENPKNTDLIRWADDGKSFIVLNEDEFANKLIPELFKHNNYPSFVRQLNMYGFHKKVGLSDNSMRASERKAKSPSEYWNPFFRRGYPDLLYLISKPKNQSATQKSKARPKSEERDEEEEFPEDLPVADGMRPRQQLTMGQEDPNQALTREQFQTVQRELSMIRRQQQQITQMLGQLKREHDALVDQAGDYHNKHSRHEHSINAILTFLATLYNRSLQNHEGAADIAKMFANALGQDKNGNVVDIDNYTFDVPDGQSQPQKKQRLLLTDGSGIDNRAKTMSPASSAQSPMPRQSRKASHMSHGSSAPPAANVEEVYEPEPEPASYQSPNGTSNQDMLSLINNSNARNSNANTPMPDFSNVLNDLENSGGTTPISSTQRDNMLRMFNNQAQGNGSSNTQPTSRNALMSPTRTPSQNQFDNRLASTKADLDSLAALQAQQDKSVENLTNLLQPLSPSGSIPGIGDGQDVPPPPLNIEDFLSSHDYFADLPNDGTENLDFSNVNDDSYNTNNIPYNFNDDEPLFGNLDDSYTKQDNDFLTTDGFTGDSNGHGHRRVESVASSEATTPKQSSVGDNDMPPDSATSSRGKGRKLSTLEENAGTKRRRV